MGLNASVVVFPVCPGSRPGLLARLLGSESVATMLPAADLAGMARSVVGVFEGAGLLSPGTADAAVTDEGATFATCQVLEGEPPGDLRWVHIGVEDQALRSTLAEIVYTATEEEWFGDLEIREHANAVAVPHVDVTCLSRPIALSNTRKRVIARSWLFIEFSYDDARVSAEIHKIRDASHAVFVRLEELLQAPVRWAVVDG